MEWSIAAGLIGQVVALGAVVIAAMKEINAQIDRRFAEGERLRLAAEGKWDARFELRERLHQELVGQLESDTHDHLPLRANLKELEGQLVALRLSLPADYVPRDIWLEHIGALNIKIEKGFAAATEAAAVAAAAIANATATRKRLKKSLANQSD